MLATHGCGQATSTRPRREKTDSARQSASSGKNITPTCVCCFCNVGVSREQAVYTSYRPTIPMNQGLIVKQFTCNLVFGRSVAGMWSRSRDAPTSSLGLRRLTSRSRALTSRAHPCLVVICNGRAKKSAGQGSTLRSSYAARRQIEQLIDCDAHHLAVLGRLFTHRGGA